MSKTNTLGHRAIRSVITLTSRTFLLNALNFAGAFALTIFLSPEHFGIFIITSTVVDILAYFSDIGLAGALVQKKGGLDDREVNATFTIQMALVTTGILVASLFTKPIQNFYGLDQTGIWLFYSLLIAFFFSSLKTIPSVLSERRLTFEKVVIPQIVETVVFNLLLIFFAWRGYGLVSFIIAVLARALSGTLTIYILVPWKPRLNFSFAAVRGLLGFGVPYQLNSFVAVFKDRVSLLILGRIIGLEGMGILGWAEKWANLPLRYFLDTTAKVAFPLFSRLQTDLTKAKSALERSVYFISTLVFPTLVGAYLLMPRIIEVIPKYSKWEPGLTTFNLFLVSAAIASISTFFTNFLNAIGKVKQVLGLMILWTILTLSLYPLMASALGYEGVAIASIIIGLTSFIPYILVRKVVSFSLLRQITPALTSSVAMFIIVTLVNPLFSEGIIGIVQTVFAGIFTYTSLLYLLDGLHLKSQVTKFLSYAKAKA
ncbi:MAG: oligosaccharide flippase family protein [Patescibacteria group bacterium]